MVAVVVVAIVVAGVVPQRYGDWRLTLDENPARGNRTCELIHPATALTVRVTDGRRPGPLDRTAAVGRLGGSLRDPLYLKIGDRYLELTARPGGSSHWEVIEALNTEGPMYVSHGSFRAAGSAAGWVTAYAVCLRHFETM